MRGVAAIVLAGLTALVAGGASHAAAQGSAAKPTASLSSSRAGARAGVMVLKFETAYICGKPRGVVIRLPKAESMPAKLVPGAVRVNGKAATAAISGRSVTVKAPASGGVTCDSIRLGTEVLTFAAAAGLGNPRTPGTYSIGIRHGTSSVVASVTIV